MNIASSSMRYRALALKKCPHLRMTTPRTFISRSHESRKSHSHRYIAVVFIGALATVWTRDLHAEAPLTKEQNRDSISSQHTQVRRSWEAPGVYAWGSNVGRVVAPDSDESVIRTPRRIPFFDGQLLRDIKLDRMFGAAIAENGDLLQWGTAYAPNLPHPVVTLRGKDLSSLAISRDRIIALSRSGVVYSIPVSRDDQAQLPKPTESSWWLFSKSADISYRTINPQRLLHRERVTKLRSGLEHLLLMTSSGRVFSAASSSDEFPSRGEMGISGLKWCDEPGWFDLAHEISALKGFEIVDVACGDHHSLVLDREGRAFAFGDNSTGQLGFETSGESPYMDVPSLLPLARLYGASKMTARVTGVAAGGNNSFLTVDAEGEGKIKAETWACGQGILGTLGNGRWTHVQGVPTKIKSLSGLFEYDEPKHTVIPIRLRTLSVGSTHVAAVMDNVTHVMTGTSAETNSRNDTNWGADIVFWGGNEHCQLGTGRRNNINTPTYIAPLDRVAEKERETVVRSKGQEREHRFQITPRHTIMLHGRRVSVEQRVECGRMCTAVYSGM